MGQQRGWVDDLSDSPMGAQPDSEYRRACALRGGLGRTRFSKDQQMEEAGLGSSYTVLK